MRKFLLLLLVVPLVATATIYRWKDKQGNLHFGDQPHQGATKVKLPPVQVITSPPIKSEKITPVTPVKAASYKSITISQPENDATVRNNQGYVAVSVNLDPPLMTGDQLVVLVDGKVAGTPQKSTYFTLTGINRGSHNVVVQVQNEKGDVVAASAPVTFHMHRPRVGMSKGRR